VTLSRGPPIARDETSQKKKPYGLSLDTPPRAQPLRPRPGFLGTAILALPSLTSSSSSFSPCRPPQLLRERVQQCYLKEGVNHYQNCKEEVKAYLESIKNVGVHRVNIGEHDRAGGV
jgi:hypothetical protein